MARKRTRAVCGSTDSGDGSEKYEIKGNCPHTSKGVDVGGLKKAWKKKEDLSCQGCKRKQHPITQKSTGQVDLWVCMYCGHIGCGITQFNHGNEHFHTLHSDCHSVVAIVDSWTVRCLQCRLDINLEANAVADHAIAFLKKNFAGSEKQAKTISEDVTTSISIEKIEKKHSGAAHDMKPKPGSVLSRRVAPILGLENIGNTCYMNSVLQCLAQTPGLVASLESSCQSGRTFRLSGGENLVNKDHGDWLPPLEGILGEGGQFSKAVYRVLNKVRHGEEFRKSGITTVNPSEILRLMKKLANTFYVGEQHDSHELLRLLLEGLKTEDLKRYQRGILNAMSICSASKEVLPKEREYLIAYKKQVVQKELVVDNIFGGSIVSILKCLECGQVTTTFESFMDISLPVESEKLKDFETPPVASEQRMSKHQQKKERKLAKRVKKKPKTSRMLPDASPQEEIAKSNSSNESASESEADIEDNLDSEHTTSSVPDDGSRIDSDVGTDTIINDVDEELSNEDTANGDQKLFPFSTLISDLVNEAASEREFGATVYGCSPKPKIPEDGGSPEPSLAMSSCSPELLTTVYGCSPEPPTVTYGGSPEPSLNEDFGSCEGGRGSPASSIEQADWEEANCQVDFRVLTQEVEEALQIRQVQERIEIPLPEPFDESTSDGFREEDLALPIGSGDDTDITVENTPPQYPLFTSDSSSAAAQLGIDERESSDWILTPDTSKHDASDETFDNLVDVQIVEEENDKEEGVTQFSEENEHSDSSGSVWGTTLANLPELDNKIYCLEHCLLQFFNEEILSGANKIGCAQCTNRKEGNEPLFSGSTSKLIHTNALKQLLFLKLPNVLTIHLKRFEIVGTRMSKICRKVTFPLVLDVSPYTSSKVECKQEEAPPIYHLYGIVEHSGHMSSGHYVAYVKINQDNSGQSDNVDGLHSTEKHPSTGCKDANSGETKKVEENNLMSNVAASKWYFVSDTHVKEVSVKEVSNAEAYILFYKRI